jgi:hypothetical protein
VRWGADAPKRAVKFSVVVLSWDGRSFSVKVTPGVIKADEKQTGV